MSISVSIYLNDYQVEESPVVETQHLDVDAEVSSKDEPCPCGEEDKDSSDSAQDITELVNNAENIAEISGDNIPVDTNVVLDLEQVGSSGDGASKVDGSESEDVHQETNSSEA